MGFMTQGCSCGRAVAAAASGGVHDGQRQAGNHPAVGFGKGQTAATLVNELQAFAEVIEAGATAALARSPVVTNRPVLATSS